MTTARDIIQLTLKQVGVLGIGQTANAEDTNDAFVVLKDMLGQWGKKRWIVPMLIDVEADGNDSISNPIGTGQYYNTPRPDKIQSAYFTQKNDGPNNVSYPLQLIWSYEDYAQIALKSLNSFPTALFYDAAFPYGNVFVYPIPGPRYEIHLIVKGDLGFPLDLDSELILPPEYNEAIRYNLAIRLCSMYTYPVDPVAAALAKLSLNTIKLANAQIPTLEMPASLYGRGNGGWNAFAGAGGTIGDTVPNPVPILIDVANYNVAADKSLYFVNFAGEVVINLTAASSRNNLPISIKDISGNASVNNIRIFLVFGETIDGLDPYIINTDYGSVTLTPSDTGYAVT
jgi:hypothetical protein